MAYPLALVVLAAILAATAGLVTNYFLSPLAGVAVTAVAFVLLIMLRAPLESRVREPQACPTWTGASIASPNALLKASAAM